MNLFNPELQKAVIAARTRTGRPIGTTVKGGKIWAVEITKEGCNTVVTDLSKPGTVDEVVKFIEAL